MTGDNGVTGDTVTRIRALLAENPGMSRTDLAKRVGVSRKTLYKHMDRMGLGDEAVKETPAVEPPPKAKTNSAKPRGKPAPPGNQRAKGNAGGSGGPVANKNAVTHGLFETVEAFLTPDERKAYAGASVANTAQIDHELRILTIRERRMLERIQNLKDAADTDGMTVVEHSHEEGYNAQGDINKQSAKRTGILGQIQAIEDALTKVQNTKAKLIEVKAKIEAKGTPDVGNGVAEIVAALNGKAAEVWADEPDGDAE